MSLTLNGIILLIGITCGYYICHKLSIREQPVIRELIETREVCKATITKKTNKDGSVDEITEFLASRESKEVTKPQPKISLKNYGVGIYHDKTMFAEVRLGGLPLFLIGESNFKESRIGIKLEF